MDSLRRRIDDLYEGFSPQLKRAARFVADHPPDVALGSLPGISDLAGVSPASLLRLVKGPGFAGYDDFQKIHRASPTPGPRRPFPERAGARLPAPAQGASTP